MEDLLNGFNDGLHVLSGVGGGPSSAEFSVETIPTAEEFFFKTTKCIINHRDIKTAMIEFAKLHVIEALKQASNSQFSQNKEYNKKVVDSILNAYSLENIK